MDVRWTIKKADRRRIDAFELWCWWRLLRVPWKARRSNQLILKEINPSMKSTNIQWKDWCWSWSSNTLATRCKELTHWKRLWCWERLQAGGEGGGRGWDGWMASLAQWTWVWAKSGRSWRTGKAGMLHAAHGVTMSRIQLSSWKTTGNAVGSPCGKGDWI